MHTLQNCFLLLVFTMIQLAASGKNVTIEFTDDTTNQKIVRPLNKDVLIIDENNDIDITGVKAHFISFSISKKLKFKVLNANGVKRFSKFILPEAFDPTNILHFPKDRNYTFTYANLKCKYFKGLIKKANGEIIEAKIEQTILPVKMVVVENNTYGNYQKYVFQISNMEEGDEVSIDYNYTIRYIDNFGMLCSFRIFFNSDADKELYQLTLSHQSDLNIDICYNNNAEPDKTTVQENTKVYHWTKNNLSGCIKEEGSIPYLSLPYLTFTIKPLELLYTLPYSFEEKYVPIYAYLAYQREKMHLGIAKSISQNVKTKQLLQFQNFINTETNDIKGDSLNYQKLMKIQNKIVDEFSFDNDTNFFKRIDIKDPTIGEDVTRMVLRDINRNELYVAAILKLGLSYFTAYVSDNRTGEINKNYFAPIYNNDYLFAIVLKNNAVQYLYPKKAKFGYYLNEMPFYFENTKAMLVSLDDYQNYKNPINDNPRQIKLPNSNINDNIRKNNILVKVNTDSLSASFDAKINLSGQYSTLTRGVYQYDYKDESVNQLYNKKIWEINDKVHLISKEINVTKKEFPFPTIVTAQYIDKSLLKKNGDLYTLNLKNWFNHIIYQNIDTLNRQLDFYPDFAGKDSYVYYIQFDKNIKLMTPLKNTEIKNEFGDLIINYTLVGHDAVRITSLFSTKKNRIVADRIKTVSSIYDKIFELDNSLITFKLE
jgi:hypothetical protein